MHSSAACLITVIQDWERSRMRIRIWPPGYGLTLCVWTQILPLEITQLVLRAEVGSGQARAAFQADDFHAGLPQLRGKDSAHCAHTDDDDIRLFSCHTLNPLIAL